MMMSSNGNVSAWLAFCEGNLQVSDGFPSKCPMTRSFDVFFDVRQEKNDWANSPDAGYLRRHATRCDVIVMFISYTLFCC